MKPHRLLATLALLCAAAAAAPAQNSNETNVDTPLWLRELSNLPPQQRSEYTYNFKKAKEAYATAHISECLGYLNSCELIFKDNPNVWSLRASALIAQRHFVEAKVLVEKVLKVQPDDSIALYNNSLICLGEGRYEDCRKDTAELLSEIKHTEGQPLVHSITFRLLLCYLMLDQEDKAKALVADVTPLDDSPLYYYSQAAFALYNKDIRAAAREAACADRIYKGDRFLLSYKQHLSFSGLEKRARETKESGTDNAEETAIPAE